MSRTHTFYCTNCEKEETLWEERLIVEEMYMGYDTCQYCELPFCINCLEQHLKEK